MSKSERINVSIPIAHCDWLRSIQKRKGLFSINEAIRDLIATAYEKDKER